MVWSKLKKRFSGHLANSVRAHVDFHVTAYAGGTSMRREWITFDGEEICRTDHIDIFYDDFGLATRMKDYCSLSIEQIIDSENYIIRALGYLDKRFGQRRLRQVELAGKEPLEVLLYKVRMTADGSTDPQHDFRVEAKQLTTRRRQPPVSNPALTAQYQKELGRSKYRKDPMTLISAIHRGELATDQLDSPEQLAVQQAFAQSETPDELFRLLQELKKKSKLVESFEGFIGVVDALGDAKGFLRPLENWEPDSHNRGRQLSSLLRHLFAEYQVPLFLDKAFSDPNPIYQAWFKAIGQGKNFRDCAGLPIQVTKKIAHHFLDGPEGYTVNAAIRYGQVLSLGGDRRIADGLLDTKLAREFRDDAFWMGLLRLFVANPMLDTGQFNPIIDFIWHQKYEDEMVFVERGVAENRGPAQPNFSLRGRTVESLLRNVEEWHARLGREREGGDLQWQKCGVSDFEYVEGTEKSKNMRIWRIRELLGSKELISEGREMQHCVASYASSCYQGECSIWSLTVVTDETEFEKCATLELAQPSNEVRQIRGKRNRFPTEQELAVIRRWCEHENLTIAPYI